MVTFARGEVPQTKAFLFADFAELLLLTGARDLVSRADLETEITLGDPDSDPEDNGGAQPSDQVEANARVQNAIESCFRQFQHRALALDEGYPFQLNGGVLARKATIGPAGYLYLFLLVCSRLASFQRKGFQQEAARAFVVLSADALRAVLGAPHSVYIFDANSVDRKGLFGTDLRTALLTLCKQLQTDPIVDVIDEQSPSGDAGVDLVAIRQMPDQAKGLICFFAQCAAQRDGWPKKTYETRKIMAFMHSVHDPYNLVFIPAMFRKANGSWANTASAQGCVLIDRLRILRALMPGLGLLSSSTFQQAKAIVDSVAGRGAEAPRKPRTRRA